MATESDKKRKKYAEVDRISNLPDLLLCHILSFLPTKQSVATTILSTRWKPLWTMVPVLDFEDIKRQNQDDVAESNDGMTFTHFVWRVYALRKPVHVKKLKLQFHNRSVVDPIYVRTWISYAIGHHLEELRLYLLGNLSQPIELPQSFYNSESLKVLRLDGEVLLNCPSFVHFPNLEHLFLGFGIKYANDDCFRRLISCSSHLKNLFVFSDPKDKNARFKLDINAPILKYLFLWGRDCQDYLLENVTNVVKAYVYLLGHRHNDEHENYGHCILKLLRAIPNVQTLTLHFTKGLSFAFTYDIPKFNNLRLLELRVSCCEWQLLPKFLESAPNLENLFLKKVNTEGPHESCWTEPPHVPKCLTSHLQSFYFLGFRSLDHELELVKYILNNAKVLKTMGIQTGLSDFEENFLILKKLPEFPRCSLTCRLEFSTVYSPSLSLSLTVSESSQPSLLLGSSKETMAQYPPSNRSPDTKSGL